jgi:hypothetical protein
MSREGGLGVRRSMLTAGSVALLVLAACGGLPYPGRSSDYTLSNVTPRGPYVEATISAGGEVLRFFFDASDESCRQLLVPDARVQYIEFGTLGQLRGNDLTCQPIGIASLAAWTSRVPRPRNTGPRPSAPVHFREFYRDAQLVFVRGEFPLAGLVGWPGGRDTVAVLPRNEACQAPSQAQSGTMYYSPTASDPLWLGSDSQRCPILGLVEPRPATTS